MCMDRLNEEGDIIKLFFFASKRNCEDSLCTFRCSLYKALRFIFLYMFLYTELYKIWSVNFVTCCSVACTNYLLDLWFLKAQ